VDLGQKRGEKELVFDSMCAIVFGKTHSNWGMGEGL
jgi:hypothetical protein